MPSEPPPNPSPRRDQAVRDHWRGTLRLTLVLLVIWAGVSLGAGILGVELLNRFRMGGFPLGFWFAQQGSIVVFVALILIYALALSRLDRRFQQALGNEES